MQELERKQKRQEALLNLLETKSLTNQGAVVRAMRAAGFDVTQPSVSRDFRELGVVKLDGRYVAAEPIRPIAPSRQPQAPLLRREMVRSIAPAGPNLLVVKTAVGAANLIAASLDELKLENIVGTLAGDDTIFIATSDQKSQKKVRRLLTVPKNAEENGSAS